MQLSCILISILNFSLVKCHLIYHPNFEQVGNPQSLMYCMRISVLKLVKKGVFPLILMSVKMEGKYAKYDEKSSCFRHNYWLDNHKG